MSVFEPVTLPAELKAEIRQLAEELGLKVAAAEGQEAPDFGSSEPLRLAPQVHIKSSYHRRAIHGELRNHPVSPSRSPWDERYPQYWVKLDEEPEGLEGKLQQEQSERAERFYDRLSERQWLPIHDAKSRVLKAIGKNRVTLVAADTGSGKSTQVPQYILDEAIAQGWGASCHVVCTQPRRLAAVSLASRVAWERGERPSQASCGYVVRWDERPPRPWGSIVFCTVGSLLPRLSRLGASHIIVDEAHTRDIHTDLLLTVLLELLRSSSSLKVIVMSATLDVTKWQQHFADFDCELVQAGGRPYQVSTYFLEDIVEQLRWSPRCGNEQELAGVWSEVDCNRGFMDPVGRFSPATLETVRSIPENLICFQLIADVLKWVDRWPTSGGVLIFLPGWHEIAVCMSRLQKDPALSSYEFVPLHSTVPPAEQYKAFHPPKTGRKVILSTDIAETSITIPDIICVIDSGLARVKKHANLEVVWASQANLMQRAGRAGRVQSGSCVHLFTRTRFSMLDPEPTPEMQRVSLDEAVLSVCDLGLDYCRNLDAQDVEEWGSCAYVMSFLKKAPDPPPPKDVRHAFRELQHVGALDKNGWLTHLGALLVRLPVSPGLGAAFYLASLLGCSHSAAQVAATLEGREVWARRPSEEQAAALSFSEASDGKRWSDVFALAKALGEFEMQYPNKQASWCKWNGLIYPVMQQLSSAREQLKRTAWELARFQGEGGSEAVSDTLEDAWPILQTMLTLAYGWNLGKMEGGRRVNAGWSKPARLAKNSVLVDDEPPSPFLTYVELTANGGRILRSSTMVTPQQLLFCGGRSGLYWANGAAMLESWLEVEADFESAALLAALRAATKLVLQSAAAMSLEEKMSWRDSDWNWSSEKEMRYEQIQKWRRCISQVACLLLPEKISVWDMPSRPLPMDVTPVHSWALAVPTAPLTFVQTPAYQSAETELPIQMPMQPGGWGTWTAQSSDCAQIPAGSLQPALHCCPAGQTPQNQNPQQMLQLSQTPQNQMLQLSQMPQNQMLQLSQAQTSQALQMPQTSQTLHTSQTRQQWQVLKMPQMGWDLPHGPAPDATHSTLGNTVPQGAWSSQSANWSWSTALPRAPH
ncbi:unnamed protein product [Effrenium voratum]|nr:unnamed protein product [Effrenium voratum]